MWRLIDTGLGCAAHNMAVDEAIAQFVREGISPPTLRLYGWKNQAVSIGCFQKITDINLPHCRMKNMAVVRRPTGGRALLHGEELTYSFSSGKSKPFSDSLAETYRLLSAAFHMAFDKVGIHATVREKRESPDVLGRSPLCFGSTSYGEIVYEGKKIIGSAQKRWNNGFLQQGSVPFTVMAEDISNIFNVGSPVLNDYPPGLMKLYPSLDLDCLKKEIIFAFEETFGIRLLLSSLSPQEALLARELEALKYQNLQWNFHGKTPNP